MAEFKCPKSSRKWCIMIPNPDEHDMGHENIIKQLKKLPKLEYYCGCDEIGGDTNMYHTHVFWITQNCVSFDRVKKLFPSAHIEGCIGNNQQNYDYVRKEGKWLNTEKAVTNLKETFFEFGGLPEDKQGKRADLENLYALIQSGFSNAEIIAMCPDYILQIDKLDRIRKTVREAEYKEKWRNVNVHYIWGLTGTGKTRYVMDTHGYINVCKVTNYDKHPFDNYQGEYVLLLDEFRSQLKFADLLQYLDGYPLNLPARYGDRVAQFTEVYIVSNIPLSQQYTNIQASETESFRALLRRIKDITYFNHQGSYTYDCSEQTYRLSRVWCDEYVTANNLNTNEFEVIAL